MAAMTSQSWARVRGPLAPNVGGFRAGAAGVYAADGGDAGAAGGASESLAGPGGRGGVGADPAGG